MLINDSLIRSGVAAQCYVRNGYHGVFLPSFWGGVIYRNVITQAVVAVKSWLLVYVAPGMRFDSERGVEAEERGICIESWAGSSGS